MKLTQRFFNVPLALLIALMSGIIAASGIGRTKQPAAQIRILRLDECDLPCWIGIIPGTTTMAGARAVVQSAFTSPDNILTIDSQEAFIHRSDGIYFVVKFNDNWSTPGDSSQIVSKISLRTGDISGKSAVPSIRDWIDLYGPPEAYFINVYKNPHVAPFLLYAKRGVQITLDALDTFDIRTEDTRIYELEIFAFLDTDGAIPWQGLTVTGSPPSIEQLTGFQRDQFRRLFR